MKNLSSDRTRKFRIEFRQKQPATPKTRLFHLISIAVLVPGSIVLTLCELEQCGWGDLAFVLSTLVFGNWVIHLIHRYLLHVPVKYIQYPYQIHTLIHHQYFTESEYEFSELGELDVILFPVWFVFVLTLVISPLAGYGAVVYLGKNTALLLMMMINVNYLLYELVHFTSHLPESSWIHRIGFFRFMRRHHWLHHHKALMGRKNFDVTFPLFDILFRTWVTRLPTRNKPNC